MTRLLTGTRAVFDRLRENPAGCKRIGDLGAWIRHAADAYDLRVVVDSGGWGIGKRLHQDPPAPNLAHGPGVDALDLPLTPDLALTLMPMMTLGAEGAFIIAEDGWTQVSADGALTAHFAETLLVSADGIEIISASGCSPSLAEG